MDTIAVNLVTLEDGLEYIVVSEEIIINNKYVYLVNKNDPDDLVIRKVETINGEEMLVGLKDKEEFDMALIYYSNKYSKKGE